MTENEKNHRLLWNELARTGEEAKYTAMKAVGLDRPYFGDCFACDECGEDCYECPLMWTKSKGDCVSRSSSYEKWSSARRPRTRKKYAKIIAEMEWKEGGWN